MNDQPTTTSTDAAPPPAYQPAGVASDVEERKLALDEQRYQLEKEQAQFQRKQAVWTAVSTIIPIAVALATVIASFYTLTKQVELQRDIQASQAAAQFQLTAAQIVANNTDPWLAKGKAQTLHDLFPKQLSQDWVDQFDAARYCQPAYEDHILFARLAVEHPDQRDSIADVWLQLYCDEGNTPFTAWLRTGKTPPPPPVPIVAPPSVRHVTKSTGK
ncbi:MAG TPA: hypothetical protein VHX14_03465 [Thermoanaerobaculia bacterium]|jgi:hypothetical protein|nr:hypothetical protein [Thermoanaerobaculia bacterium]